MKSPLFNTAVPKVNNKEAPIIFKEAREAVDLFNAPLRERLKLIKFIDAYGLNAGLSEEFESGTGHLSGPIKGIQKAGIQCKTSKNDGLVLAGRGNVCGPTFATIEDREASLVLINDRYNDGLYRTSPQQWSRQISRQDGNRIWAKGVGLNHSIKQLAKGKVLLRDVLYALDNNKVDDLLYKLTDLITPIINKTDFLVPIY
jgi:hypothetical protein